MKPLRDDMLAWGRRPQPLGFTAFGPEWLPPECPVLEAAEAASSHSGN